MMLVTSVLFVTIRRPPISTHAATLLRYTTLCRSPLVFRLGLRRALAPQGAHAERQHRHESDQDQALDLGVTHSAASSAPPFSRIRLSISGRKCLISPWIGH